MGEAFALAIFTLLVFLPEVVIDLVPNQPVELGESPIGRGPSRGSNSAAGIPAPPARRHLNQEESHA